MSTAGMTLTGKIRYWTARLRYGKDPEKLPCTPRRAAELLAEAIARDLEEDAQFERDWAAGKRDF
jgi:hypothetical protein